MHDYTTAVGLGYVDIHLTGASVAADRQKLEIAQAVGPEIHAVFSKG